MNNEKIESMKGTSYPIYVFSAEEIKKARESETAEKIDGLKELTNLVVMAGGTADDILFVKDKKEPSGYMGMIEENIAHKLARVMGDIAVKNGDMTPEEADDYAEHFIQDSEELADGE